MMETMLERVLGRRAAHLRKAGKQIRQKGSAQGKVNILPVTYFLLEV